MWEVLAGRGRSVMSGKAAGGPRVDERMHRALGVAARAGERYGNEAQRLSARRMDV